MPAISFHSGMFVVSFPKLVLAIDAMDRVSIVMYFVIFIGFV